MYSKRNVNKQAGFIITIELVLITTILGIGLFVGIAAIRDALFKHYILKQSTDVIVSDNAGVVLGKAIGFDEHEAPLIPYIDRTVGNGNNYRVLIGIRDDRFTTREPVYFTNLNCEGPVYCIKKPSAELTDNRGYDLIPGTGAVSYLHALQGAPVYAVGPSEPDDPTASFKPGKLYRQSAVACEYTDAQAALGSRYLSQKVVDGEPCDSPFQLPLGGSGTPVTTCSGRPGTPTCPVIATPLFPACGTVMQGNGNNNLRCQCPDGWYDVGATGNGVGTVHTCCPEGSEPNINPGGGLPVTCANPLLFVAESVPNINDPALNALEPFEAPFTVNLPADVDSFVITAPDDCEGNPLPDGSCPVNTDYPVFTLPDGIEGN